MRAETLVFCHVLAAAALAGALLAVALLATAGAEARITLGAAALVTGAALATVALGEAAKARADAAGAWLDVGSVLGYAGLLAPSVALLAVARRSTRDPRWNARTAGLAWGMIVVALATTFTMAAKPF